MRGLLERLELVEGTFRYEGNNALDMCYAITDLIYAIKRRRDFPPGATKQLLKVRDAAQDLDELVYKLSPELRPRDIDFSGGPR